MTILRVISAIEMQLDGKTYRIAIGKGGFAAKKREGDHATPLGEFTLRECWFRADKLAAPKTGLPLREIRQTDGWCDDPQHADYNRHVKLPFTASHEMLWRKDDRYDLIIPLSYNDNPPVAGLGSAIFMHIAEENYAGTEGCVALAKNDLLEILAQVTSKTKIVIEPGA